MKYFIKEDFYFDIDKFNQLRITGPENHLLLGLAFPDNNIHVNDYFIRDGQLEINLKLSTPNLETHIPIVTDIRTLRSYSEGQGKIMTFDKLYKLDDLMPEKIEKEKMNHKLKFISSYIDDKGLENHYGAELLFPKNAEVSLTKLHFKASSKDNLKLKIRTINNIFQIEKISISVFVKESILPAQTLSPFLLDLYEEAGRQIAYLIRTKRTSGFEYGTIFPRDWIESADLGIGDLTEETIDYMYKESMKFVTEGGEGWHENIVGHYQSRLKRSSENGLMLIDKKMIDIEPHYILGMERFSKNFLTNEENLENLRHIARYIMNQANEKSLITFKKITEAGEEYYQVGNWRDSILAFPKAKSHLAPYDVNCVFYPESLRVIKKYPDYFDLNSKDRKLLDDLIEKWSKNKDKYKLYHDENLLGYSLALNGKKRIPLPIPHLDESYDLFYSSPSMEEIYSFAIKLIDPDYFYTPVGPILVSNDEENLTSKNYHGKVIWPKQAAFSVAGLYKHYQFGVNAGWPENVIEVIKKSILKTCRACFKGWLDLAAVPELYYYDEKIDKARFYTDQEDYEG